MSRPRRQVVGVLAAATVAAAGLVAPAPASAMTWSCQTRHAVSVAYIAVGEAFRSLGNYEMMMYYYGKSAGVTDNCS